MYQKTAITDPIGQEGSLSEFKEAKASLQLLINCSNSTQAIFGDPKPISRGSNSAW
jgi:hypothetical protein